MDVRSLALTALACAAVGGCVVRTRTESTALRQPWPTAPAAAPAVRATPTSFPSVTGDILAGTSPQTLAAARARQSQALTQALAKP